MTVKMYKKITGALLICSITYTAITISMEGREGLQENLLPKVLITGQGRDASVQFGSTAAEQIEKMVKKGEVLTDNQGNNVNYRYILANWSQIKDKKDMVEYINKKIIEIHGPVNGAKIVRALKYFLINPTQLVKLVIPNNNLTYFALVRSDDKVRLLDGVNDKYKDIGTFYKTFWLEIDQEVMARERQNVQRKGIPIEVINFEYVIGSEANREKVDALAQKYFPKK